MTVVVRTDLTAAEVRKLAKAASTPEQARRLLAIALVLEGSSREDAARSLGMDRQTLRDWVHRFNTAGAAGLVDRKAPGRQRRLSALQQQELARCLESGPELARDGVARWRLVDLCALVERRFGVRYQERGMGKLVRALGFSRISARPQHPKSDPEAQAEFKKTARADRCRRRRESAGEADRDLVPGRGQDRPEGRVDPPLGRVAAPAAGQTEHRRCRCWAQRGTRPRQPRDQRYQAAYLLAAACPEAEKTAALVLPHVNTEAMNLHLAEIARHIAVDAHAVVILDHRASPDPRRDVSRADKPAGTPATP